MLFKGKTLCFPWENKQTNNNKTETYVFAVCCQFSNSFIFLHQKQSLFQFLYVRMVFEGAVVKVIWRQGQLRLCRYT